MKKIALFITTLMLAAAPAMAQQAPEPNASSPENTQEVSQPVQQAPALKHAHSKHHHKGKHHAHKKHAGKKHGKKHHGAKLSPAEKTHEVGNTSAGDSLPPVTDNSAGPQ